MKNHSKNPNLYESVSVWIQTFKCLEFIKSSLIDFFWLRWCIAADYNTHVYCSYSQGASYNYFLLLLNLDIRKLSRLPIFELNIFCSWKFDLYGWSILINETPVSSLFTLRTAIKMQSTLLVYPIRYLFGYLYTSATCSVLIAKSCVWMATICLPHKNTQAKNPWCKEAHINV